MTNALVLARILFDGDGDLYLLGAIAVLFAGVVIGLYTRRGSQINDRPGGPRGPGPRGG